MSLRLGTGGARVTKVRFLVARRSAAAALTGLESGCRTPGINIRQLTDVLRCNLQQHFRRKRHRAGRLRNRIDAMMTQTRPTELHQRRILMTRRPAAAAEARGQVRAIIRAWELPVDPDIAVLLTSDLVTHAIVNWDSETITLAVRCSRDQLRVDVYDTSLPLPMAVDEQVVRQAWPGLALVASLSAEWGSFLTFTGKAMYVALAFQTDWLQL
jgi:hypothetical protein